MSITNKKKISMPEDLSKSYHNIRKVSNGERAFLWRPDCTVSMITKIEGNVSPEDLRQSISKVKQIHPFIGAKIVFNDDHSAEFSTENVPLPNFRIVKRISDTQWFEELKNEIKIPFDLEDGPMIRFTLLHSNEVSDLIITCNHSICDGMSLSYLVRDLLINYVDSKKEVEVLNPPEIMELIPKRKISFSSLMMRIILYTANKKWKKSPHYFTPKDYTALQNAYQEKIDFGTVFLELEPHETKTLLKSCKKNGVTIGSAVTAAFIASYTDIIGPFKKNQKQISLPFDLRRHTAKQIGDVFCFCAGASQFPYNYDGKKSFWKNASILNKEIQKRVKKLDSSGLEIPGFDPALIDALTCFANFKKLIPEAYTKTKNLEDFSKDTKNVAFSFAEKYESMYPGIIPSNLGRLDIPETYGDLRINRMIFLPAWSDSVPLILGGISIGDKMVFSLNYPYPTGMGDSITIKMIQIRNCALKYLGFPNKANDMVMKKGN